MNEQEKTPTTWELMRRLDQVIEQLARMENRMLTTDVFKAYQEATERRFQEVEKDQQSWTVESRGEHVRLDAKVDTLRVDLVAQLDSHRARQEAVERGQRESRSRTWLAVGIAVLGFLSSLGVGLILQATGTGA